MGKFYSVGGMNYQGERWRDRPKHQPAAEFYKNRDETSHTTSGFDPGTPIQYEGEAARVLHEEYDHHTGEVTVYIQKSDRNGAGLRKAVWCPGDGPRQMVLRSKGRTT